MYRGGGHHSSDFDGVISVSSLFAAWKKFRRGKRSKKDVAEFELNLENNIFKLHTDLRLGNWQPDHYETFFVQDPKLRKIHKASVRDRVLYQAVYHALYQIFDMCFIHHSYSSRNNKGTHKGVTQFDIYARKVTANYSRRGFALKCDIRKFFDSIDHGILIDMLRKRISDERLMKLLVAVIRSFESIAHKGLPLGNVTSQILANIYLNELDQHLKHGFKTQFYIRYVDDFVILSQSRGFLMSLVPHIQKFLSDRLKLNLHPDKIFIRTIKQGVDFLGYVTLPGRKVIRTRTKKRMITKIREVRNLYLLKKISCDQLKQILVSYSGMLSHCNNRQLGQKIDQETLQLGPA